MFFASVGADNLAVGHVQRGGVLRFACTVYSRKSVCMFVLLLGLDRPATPRVRTHKHTPPRDAVSEPHGVRVQQGTVVYLIANTP